MAAINVTFIGPRPAHQIAPRPDEACAHSGAIDVQRKAWDQHIAPFPIVAFGGHVLRVPFVHVRYPIGWWQPLPDIIVRLPGRYVSRTGRRVDRMRSIRPLAAAIPAPNGSKRQRSRFASNFRRSAFNLMKPAASFWS